MKRLIGLFAILPALGSCTSMYNPYGYHYYNHPRAYVTVPAQVRPYYVHPSRYGRADRRVPAIHRHSHGRYGTRKPAVIIHHSHEKTLSKDVHAHS